ncbi:DUF1000-domain-containing protein [Fomitiporia mediterranea MF3/22]|uniref:DUF1000-domain-containing protein n=1 Tax=Fomitiporia mediterranea (strain MF3/22) TaxID=694068 RepID=UPI00044074AA|nr:DUF1000-domain-containing protein [Fomitiporia mediterranea MF3/22]EJD06680.1 DUF1000-domain-containing protein [Fomitiporia mediterranea MF3/22]
MSHNHSDHSDCHDEAHDHDHDDISETGPADNLYPYIDLQNIVALNITDDTPGKAVIKPWHERQDETVWVESDADDQIIFRIPFTGSVKLRSVLLKCGPGEQTPARLCLFANEDNVDFSDIAEKEPHQEFAVPQSRDIGEYAVKASKFSNLSSLTIFFPEAQGGDSTKVFYIGLRGSWSARKRDAVITVYESQANLADHEKIQGTDGGVSASRLGS